MKKIVVILGLLICSSAWAGEATTLTRGPVAASAMQTALGMELIDRDYRKLDTYKSWIPGKARWYKAQTKEQMDEFVQIAQAKGDDTLARKILNTGYYDVFDKGLHLVWDNKWAISTAVLAIAFGLRSKQYASACSSLPLCEDNSCRANDLHKHLDGMSKGLWRRGKDAV